MFGIRGASYALGVAEWSFGLLLLAGFWSRRLGLLGAVGSTLTYLTTLTLIFSTPGAWEASAGGFPAMGGATSFLLKDLVLLAGSILLLKADLPDDIP
ncbi:Inner membrane protein YkgB [compost metagenome]